MHCYKVKMMTVIAFCSGSRDGIQRKHQWDGADDTKITRTTAREGRRDGEKEAGDGGGNEAENRTGIES